MKYIAVFDDSMLANFRRDDGGLTLVMTDKMGAKRAVSLKPLIRYTLVDKKGESVYLTQEHVDELVEFESQQAVKEVFEQIMNNIDEVHKWAEGLKAQGIRGGKIPDETD